MKSKFQLPVFICMLLCSFSIKSQTYGFSVSTEPYLDLNGGTPLVNETWDDPQFVIPIGFGFKFYNDTLYNLYLDFNSIILADGPTAEFLALIILFGAADLVDRGFNENTLLSPITYKTVGNPGSRVLTVEWENAGFYNELSEFGISTDYVNFQLKLFEADGDIVFHYGPASVTHPEIDYDFDGPIIGLSERYDLLNDVFLEEIMLLSGDPLNPEVITTSQQTFLNGSIPAGTVYTFSRQTTAIHVVTNLESKPFYFPNPCTQYVTLKPELREEIKSPVFVINATGQLVRSDHQPERIEFDGLPAGMYQLLFQTSTGQVAQRISLMK